MSNQALIGNPGNITFVIGPGAGNDTLQFSASLFTNFAAAMADAKQVGVNTVFTIDANDSVTLPYVNINNLTASNFHFA